MTKGNTVSALAVTAWRVWHLDAAHAPVRVAASGSHDDTLMQVLHLEKPHQPETYAVFCLLHGGAAAALPPNPADLGEVALEVFLPLGTLEGVQRWRYMVLGRCGPLVRRNEQGAAREDGTAVSAETRPGHAWGRGPAGYAWPLAWPLDAREPVAVAHVTEDPAGLLRLAEAAVV